MRSIGLCAALAASLVVAGPRPVRAGANANAKIMFHLLPKTTKNACGTRGTPACHLVTTNGTLYPTVYYAYLITQDGNQLAGIGGLQCGIVYDDAPQSGVDVFAWTLCATLEFASTGWPASGGGNLITWDTATRCQRFIPAGNDGANGVVGNAGYLYMAAYSPDLLRVVPRPVDGRAKVADCSANEDLVGGVGYPASVPSHLGYANFTASGQISGYNPCGLIDPVEPTTWSGLKGAYGGR